MLPVPDRTPEELNACLERRLESFVSDLLVLDGMTKRGAVLPAKYRASAELPAIQHFVLRVLEALEKGEPSKQPWDRGDRDAA